MKETELLLAISTYSPNIEDTIKKIETLLTNGADPNEAGIVKENKIIGGFLEEVTTEYTPLTYCIKNLCDSRILDLLLQHGAEPTNTKPFLSPLWWAIHWNDKSAFQKMIEHLKKNGRDLKSHSESLACKALPCEYSIDYLKLLIDLNINLTKSPQSHEFVHDTQCTGNFGLTPIEEAVKFKRYEAVELILAKLKESKVECRHLLASAMNYAKSEKVAERLFNELRDYPSSHLKILLFAIRNNYIDLVKQVLDQSPTIINTQNEKGTTPLVCAVRDSNLDAEMINTLVKRGADINPKSTGSTLLDWAFKRNDPKIFQLLLDLGAKGGDFESLFDHAFWNYDQEDLMEILLKNKSSIDLENKFPTLDLNKMRDHNGWTFSELLSFGWFCGEKGREIEANIQIWGNSNQAVDKASTLKPKL